MEANRNSFIFYGVLDSNLVSLNAFNPCSPAHLTTENIYTYVARSTDLSGETVTIINSDPCGELAWFPFESIDGATYYSLLKHLRDELIDENAHR